MTDSKILTYNKFLQITTVVSFYYFVPFVRLLNAVYGKFLLVGVGHAIINVMKNNGVIVTKEITYNYINL